MITPNKVVTLGDSALALTPVIMSQGPVSMKLTELWTRVHDSSPTVEQFIFALEILYLTGRISVDLESGMVSYAS